MYNASRSSRVVKQSAPKDFLSTHIKINTTNGELH